MFYLIMYVLRPHKQYHLNFYFHLVYSRLKSTSWRVSISHSCQRLRVISRPLINCKCLSKKGRPTWSFPSCYSREKIRIENVRLLFGILVESQNLLTGFPGEVGPIGGTEGIFLSATYSSVCYPFLIFLSSFSHCDLSFIS